jgi:hypothetical protein
VINSGTKNPLIRPTSGVCSLQILQRGNDRLGFRRQPPVATSPRPPARGWGCAQRGRHRISPPSFTHTPLDVVHRERRGLGPALALRAWGAVRVRAIFRSVARPRARKSKPVKMGTFGTIRAMYAGQRCMTPEVAAEIAEHATEDPLPARKIDVAR